MSDSVTLVEPVGPALGAGATSNLLNDVAAGRRPLGDIGVQGLDRAAAAEFVITQARLLNAVATSAKLPTVRILAELLTTQLAEDMGQGSSNTA